MTIPKINNAHGSDTRNIINSVIDSINVHGKSIQDLVAKGQLTPAQYTQLLKDVNGLISKGEVKPDDLSPDLLELINNSDGTPFNILSIPRPKSVTPNTTTFIDISTNLIDVENNILENTRIEDDGSLISDTTANNMNLANYISVESNQSYTFYGVVGYAEYNYNFSFIKFIRVFSLSEALTFKTDVNTTYIRPIFYGHRKYNAQINEGTTLLPYEPHYNKLSNVELGEKSVGIEETDFITSSKTESTLNLFDRDAVISGGYYDGTTLEWVSNSVFIQSEFIEANTGDEIKISETPNSHYVVFKNFQGEIFSGISVGDLTSRTFIMPNNAVSFSLNLRATYSDNLMVVKNKDIPKNYTPYGTVDFTDERLKSSLLDYVSKNIVVTESSHKFENINFLGDSITRGFEPGTGGQLPITWASLVEKEFNATGKNYGLDGSNLAGSSTTTMVNRYESMNDNADLVIVSGGTNDWRSGVPLGTIDDIEKTTFYGALKEMMNGLYTKYPNATIVFSTPLHRAGDISNTAGVDLKEFRNAIIEVGEMYGIAVLDLYASSGIYPDNTVNHDTYVPDGRHPNVAGHRKMASRIIGFLKTL